MTEALSCLNSERVALDVQPPLATPSRCAFGSRSPSIIILISLLTLGVYFAYDVPAALPDRYKQHFDLTNSQFELLYTVYSAPSIITPFLGGVAADHWLGPHSVGMITCTISLVGCGLIAVGCRLYSFNVALLGRFFMGIGGEATFSLQQTLCAIWFDEDLKPLAMGTAITLGGVGEVLNFLIAIWFDEDLKPLAMGTAITLGGVGEVLNFLITVPLCNAVGFEAANAWAVLPCVLSVAAAVVLFALDVRQRQASVVIVDGCVSTLHNLAENPMSPISQELGQSLLCQTEEISISNAWDAKVHPADVNQATSWREIVTAEPALLYAINFLCTAPYYLFPSMCKDLISVQQASGVDHDDTNDDARENDYIEWHSTAVLVTFYSLPILASPLIGLAVAGKSAHHLRLWLVGGSSAVSAGLIIFATKSFCSVHQNWVVASDVALSAIVALGFTAVGSVLPPCLAMAVSESQRGKAFGLWSSSQAAGVFMLSIAVGAVADAHGVEASVVLMGSSGAASAALGAVLVLKKIAHAPIPLSRRTDGQI
eukprot:CAMPEP_0171994146 /NCGR_PEP_ID=MMETSP0993-20121228/278806_1 /TAXON_ID=483369 /ORGANISM="non described non described, Strain CCMP2098" /LENGTH=540 /DNA_ID=CAMNT_0012647215 /DNA_START=94 /DNA_END=1716 /DNA_ORIENTATION=-